MDKLTRSLISIFFTLVFLTPLLATNLGAQTQNPRVEMISFISSVNTSPGNLGTLRENAVERFVSLDIDGNGFDVSDIKISHQMAESKVRRAGVSAWTVNDLNADGMVSRAELEIVLTPRSRVNLRGSGISFEPTPEQAQQMLDQIIGEAMADDINGDGFITLSEVMITAAATYRENPNQRFRLWDMISFDLNGDARVSKTEFETALDDFLNWMDMNDNGVLDSDETRIFRRAYQDLRGATRSILAEQDQARLRSSLLSVCGRLTVPDNAVSVVIGAHEGQALSSVRVGGAKNVTSVIDINILDGTEELFLMLDSYESVIWRITGQTNRVAGVGISGDISGVIGIAPESVQYFEGSTCNLDLWKPSYSYGSAEAAVLAKVLGQKPNIIFSGYELGLINLPGGEPSRAYRYPDAQPLLTSLAARKVEADMLRFNPGGVVEIEPEEIVTEANVEPYTLLPQEAGLAQLAQAGAIEPTGIWLNTPVRGLRMGFAGIEMDSSNGGVFETNGGDDLILDAGNTYRIVGGSIGRSFMGQRAYIIREPIEFPVGLGGAHSVTFLLPHGIRPPSGDISGSELQELQN